MLGLSGVPRAVVFVPTLGRHWTVGASHELLEMLENPALGRISNAYLREVCDPVESVWYRTIRGVWLADFVTPAWFSGGHGPWDIGRQLGSAASFTRGGKATALRNGRPQLVGPGASRPRYPSPIKLRLVAT